MTDLLHMFTTIFKLKDQIFKRVVQLLLFFMASMSVARKNEINTER